MSNEDLIELNKRKLKEARFLWEQQYLNNYNKKFGVVDSEKKRIKFYERRDNAYFQNKKLKIIRNKSYLLKSMNYNEK